MRSSAIAPISGPNPTSELRPGLGTDTSSEVSIFRAVVKLRTWDRWSEPSLRWPGRPPVGETGFQLIGMRKRASMGSHGHLAERGKVFQAIGLELKVWRLVEVEVDLSEKRLRGKGAPVAGVVKWSQGKEMISVGSHCRDSGLYSEGVGSLWDVCLF